MNIILYINKFSQLIKEIFNIGINYQSRYQDRGNQKNNWGQVEFKKNFKEEWDLIKGNI